MTNKEDKFTQQFKAARRAGTPLIAIQTPDPAESLLKIKQCSESDVPVVVWNCLEGWSVDVSGRAGNDLGLAAIRLVLGDADVAAATRIPAEMLDAAQGLPEKTILVIHLAQRLFDQNDSAGAAQFVQGLWNLRDSYKQTFRSIVLFAPAFILPAELTQDTLVLDEPLPDDKMLRDIVRNTYGGVDGLPELDEEKIARAVDTLRGLAAFPAEQVMAMSLRKSGIDYQGLWERKRKLIEATPGLEVWQGGETFEDVGGCEQVKFFLRRVIAGRRAPKTVVWLDEIEKALGGSGDTTGISQDYLGTVLSFMQDNNCSGVIFVGVPGAAKSALAKATGAEAQVPTIRLDLNGMKGSLVGESEQRLRTALKVVKAVGDGGIFFIATCNKLDALPPELRRRFKMGLFYFDLPTAEERARIWEMYQAKYKLSVEQMEGNWNEFSRDWTGAEIQTCCELARDLDLTLTEAAAFIVPVSKSSPETIATLRKQAQGKFLSASYAGTYKGAETNSVAAPTAQRKLNVEN